MAIQPTIRIDLGHVEEPQPCAMHRKDGVQDDCDKCEETQPRRVPVPELDGLWVEVRNPKALPYGEKKQLFATTLPILPGDSIEDQLRKREMAEERLERIVKGLITAWNVKAVDDPDGEVLPVPRDDPRSFDRAPDIVGPVIAGIGRAQSEPALPKASATG